MAYSDDLVSDVLGIHARATEELVYNGTLLALGPVCSYEFTGISFATFPDSWFNDIWISFSYGRDRVSIQYKP